MPQTSDGKHSKESSDHKQKGGGFSELGMVGSRNQSRPLEGGSKTTSNPDMTQIDNSMADNSSIISRNQLMDQS
jgi:hypothetical protein